MSRHNSSHHGSSQHPSYHGPQSNHGIHGSNGNSSNPLARLELYDQPELSDLLIVQFTIADASPGAPLQDLGDDMAETLRAVYDERQSNNITGQDVVEAWEYMKQHPDDRRNPYGPWRRACEAYQEGMRGRCCDTPDVPGEKSLADFRLVYVNAVLETTRQGMGWDSAEMMRPCVETGIEETGRGIADHGHHRGPCIKALAESEVPANGAPLGSDRVHGGGRSGSGGGSSNDGFGNTSYVHRGY